MSTRLDNKVIVITGAASGMGRAATLRFLDEGAAVVAADLNVETGNETTKLAHDAGHQNIEFVRTDVTQESDIESMIATAFSSGEIVFGPWSKEERHETHLPVTPRE